MKIKSFPYISTTDAKILILGTMPGERSLKLQQYYGHGGNSFWKILHDIFKLPMSDVYETRKDILLKNRIALWDVLKGCEREGSADSAILEEEVNDFDQFFKDHPQIQMIAFNGKNAEDYFKSFYPRDLGFKTLTLPSTSPANTWKSYDQKLAEWTGLLMF